MRKNQIYFFFAVFILFNMAANFAHPVTPAFIVERNLDSSMFGIALAAMNTMNFLFSPFWGRYCSYVPTKRILTVSSIGYAAGQIIFLFAQSEITVVFGRLFAGIFTGGCYTGFSNYIINTSADSTERDRNLTVFITIQSVSSACGFFLGGMMGLISTEFSILIQIISLSLSGILFGFVCADDTPWKEHPQTALTMKDVNPFRSFISVKAYISPMLALIFSIVAISAIGQNSYEQCFNYYIKDQFGMSSVYNGTFKAIIACITLILNATVCTMLQKKTDINRSFLYILEACFGLIAMILLFRWQYLFISVYILYSSVNVIRLPLLQSMVAMRSNSVSRNSLMGFYQAMTSLGGIFGALFAGLIYKLGSMLPFVLAFCAYGLSIIIGIIYISHYRKEK